MKKRKIKISITVKTLLFIGIIVSSALGCGGSSGSPEEEKEVIVKPEPEVIAGPEGQNPENWVLETNLSDEFNGASLATIWDNDPNDWGPWSWEPDNAYVENENLHIRMRYEEHTRGNTDMFYKSGIVRSLDTITYGYFEASIKGIETFPAASPAFWVYSLSNEVRAWGLEGDEEGEPTYSEVDFVEMLQAEWHNGGRAGANVIDMNLHTRVIENGVEVWKRPNGFPDLCKNVWEAPWDPRDDFHTYGCEVGKDNITWYIDGVQVAQKSNVYWHLPMHVTLSLGLRYPHVTYSGCPNGESRCPVPSAATTVGFPTTMLVDWVRVYRKKP